MGLLEEASAVNSPSHYASVWSVECIDIAERHEFNIGNALKYSWRSGRKDKAKYLEDLEKCAWYIRRELHRIAVDPLWYELDIMVKEVKAFQANPMSQSGFSIAEAMLILMVPPQLTPEYSSRLRQALGFIEEACEAVREDQRKILE